MDTDSNSKKSNVDSGTNAAPHEDTKHSQKFGDVQNVSSQPDSGYSSVPSSDEFSDVDFSINQLMTRTDSRSGESRRQDGRFPAPGSLPISPEILSSITSQITANVLSQLKASSISAVDRRPSTELKDFEHGTHQSQMPTPTPDPMAPAPLAPVSPAVSRSSSVASSRSRSPPREVAEGPKRQHIRTRSKEPDAVSGQNEARSLIDKNSDNISDPVRPTKHIKQLFYDVAKYVIENEEPKHSLVISPPKMQLFYARFKVSGDILPWKDIFDDRTSSISRLYRDFSISHHLIQDGLSERPDIPSLTPDGFAAWSTLIASAFPDLEFQRLSMITMLLPVDRPDHHRKTSRDTVYRHMFPDAADREILEKLQNRLNLHCHLNLILDSSRKSAASNSLPSPSMRTRESLYAPAERERKPYRPTELSPIAHWKDEGERSRASASWGSTSTVRAKIPRKDGAQESPTRLYSEVVEHTDVDNHILVSDEPMQGEVKKVSEGTQPTGVTEPVLTEVDSPNDTIEGYERSRCVTWTCICGTELSDCYTELEPGSLAELQEWLRTQQTPNPSVPALDTTANSAEGAAQIDDSHQQSSGNEANSDRNATTDLVKTSASRGQNQSSQDNNRSTRPLIGDSDRSSASFSTRPSIFYLLLCIPEGLSGLKLRQQQILDYVCNTTSNVSPNTVRNDKELFQLLRKTYRGKRKLFFSSLWPKAVIRVSLAHFLVDMSEYIELKHYGCVGAQPDSCQCIPPITLLQPSPQAQYYCQPREPRFKPPIGTNYLTHYFQNGSCIKNDKIVFVLNQLPKRVGECVVVSGTERLEAWGLEFEEGWDQGRLRSAIFAILITGCLIFAVTWAIIRKDAQTAFTIAAFFVAITVFVGGYAASAEPRIVHM